MEENKRKKNIPDIAGQAVGNFKNAQDIENKTQWSRYHTKGATGFGAEDANSANDRFHFREVEDIGRNCDKDGPDRIVDGVSVQTKYYDSAHKSVKAAFGGDGVYRYYGEDSKPMLLEVPKEQYQEAIKEMSKKIEEGRIPGITDPEKAKDLIREGCVTYKQARNIAKAGNIDSLIFDAKLSIVSTSSAFGISFIINFAVLRYKDVNLEDALKISFIESLKTGGFSFASSLLTRQLLRTSIGRNFAALSTNISKSAVDTMYNAALGKELAHKLAAIICQKQLYGGAAKNVVIKFMRTSVVNNVALVLVYTIPDFWYFMNNRKSWKELTVSITSSISGMGAFAIAAKIGVKTPGPAPVKMVVSLILGTLGALAASGIAEKILKTNEEKKEYDLIQCAIKTLCEDYLIVDETEFDTCLEEVQNRNLIDNEFIIHIRERQTEEEKENYIYTKLKKVFEYIIKARKVQLLPSSEVLVDEVKQLSVTANEINSINNNLIKE